jgi:hypothetical protein
VSDSGHVDHESDTVRFVSGLAALPSGIRGFDGVGPELAAAVVLVALVVVVFWVWG